MPAERMRKGVRQTARSRFNPDDWTESMNNQAGLWLEHKPTKTFITVEPDEDSEEQPSFEVWVGDNKDGNHDSLEWFSDESKAERFMRKWQRENPNGWE